jgi:hypothetical protein
MEKLSGGLIRELINFEAYFLHNTVLKLNLWKVGGFRGVSFMGRRPRNEKHIDRCKHGGNHGRRLGHS